MSENMLNETVDTQKYSDVSLTGDRSGSMHTMGNSLPNGAIEFLQKQVDMASTTNSNCNITMTVFNHTSNVLFSKNTKEITPTDYDTIRDKLTPTGATRLYDTAIEQIENQMERVDKLVEQGIPLNNIEVIFALLTDGEDNESKNTAMTLRNKMDMFKEKYDATCLFLAANQDAICQGAKYGFDAKTCLSMGNDPKSCENAMRSVSDAVGRVMSGVGDGEFTQCERTSSIPNSDPDSPPPGQFVPLSSYVESPLHRN
jgi:hypothetical protein